MLQRTGVDISYFHPDDDLESHMRPETRVVFLEAPGSNTFEMLDVARACEIAHAGGAVTMMDNTWATPMYFQPLQHRWTSPSTL